MCLVQKITTQMAKKIENRSISNHRNLQKTLQPLSLVEFFFKKLNTDKQFYFDPFFPVREAPFILEYLGTPRGDGHQIPTLLVSEIFYDLRL